jgi:acyl-CoA thioester hydrolase
MRVDELIEGSISVPKIGNSSMEQIITLHGADDGSLRAEIRLVAVMVDLPTGRPERIPDAARVAFGHAIKESANG